MSMSLWLNILNLEDAFNFMITNLTNFLPKEKKRLLYVLYLDIWKAFNKNSVNFKKNIYLIQNE